MFDFYEIGDIVRSPMWHVIACREYIEDRKLEELKKVFGHSLKTQVRVASGVRINGKIYLSGFIVLQANDIDFELKAARLQINFDDETPDNSTIEWPVIITYKGHTRSRFLLNATIGEYKPFVEPSHMTNVLLEFALETKNEIDNLDF